MIASRSRAPGSLQRAAVTAPPAAAFARWPASWYVLCPSRQLRHRPRSFELFGRRIVAYRTAEGRAVAMDGRCWHMGADLGDGRIVGDCLQCPFHGWRFDATGACAHIPAQAEIPGEARQQPFETAERGGLVWVFPAGEARFALPFFADAEPGDLAGAAPFEFHLRCPWWLVGTNGFDLQHFAAAHDRRLLGRPEVSSPHPAARRIVAEFEVCGRSWRDRLTHRFSGPRLGMDVTVWGGTLAFVAARFQNERGAPRTTSYGMVEIRPVDDRAAGTGPQTLVRVHIFVRRRGSAALARVDTWVRRGFIRAFLRPDARMLDELRFDPGRLIEADRVMVEYLRWLAPVSHGRLCTTGEQA